MRKEFIQICGNMNATVNQQIKTLRYLRIIDNMLLKFESIRMSEVQIRSGFKGKFGVFLGNDEIYRILTK